MYVQSSLHYWYIFLRRELLWIVSQKARFTPGPMLLQSTLQPDPSAFRKDQNPSYLN